MILTTNRLILRELTLADTEKTFLYSREDSRKTGIPNEVYADVDAARETVELLMSSYEHGWFPYVLAVDLKDNHEYIGHVSLSEIPCGIEIGYAICEKYQGRGFATEAVKEFVRWGKGRFGLDKIYGLVRPGNEVSIQVLRKAGFSFVVEDRNGEYIKDSHYFVYVV